MKIRDRLEIAIRLIVDYHERALWVLDGSWIPTTDELSEVVKLARMDTPKDPSPELVRLMRADEIAGVVVTVGGWDRIAKATAYIRSRYAPSWAIFEEYVTFAEAGGISHTQGESVIKRLCDLHDVDKDTVVRKKQAIIYLIAKCAIMCPDRQLALPLPPEK